MKNADQIIDGLGGTSVVARLCGLTTGAVSQWRTSPTGIPRPWVKFFEAIRPDLFGKERSARRRR